MRQPCSHNIREVVLGSSNRKLSVSCDNIPNDPQFPRQCFLLLDLRLWQWISYQGKDKENTQALRRRREGGGSWLTQGNWREKVFPTRPALVTDIFQLCVTLSDKTLLNIYCKDPMRHSE